jgi:hypothetical protein
MLLNVPTIVKILKDQQFFYSVVTINEIRLNGAI